MQIGEKIKELRLSKMMTQSDLAGDHITRNMLSSIEHGTALPSLPTALYIAQRLGVPIGYLLADQENDFFYKKMTEMPNIHRAFSTGDYVGCLSLLSALGDTKDDELSLLRCECEYGRARDAFIGGSLRASAAALDRALRAGELTVYHTDWLRERIAVLFRYLQGLSGTFVSDVLDAEEIERAHATGDFLIEYVAAVQDLENDRPEAARTYLTRYSDTVYAQRLSALLMMREGDYLSAQKMLEALLAQDELTFGVLLYEVFGDLEICCRKNDDYKRAYEFSMSRLGLLERLLEEA